MSDNLAASSAAQSAPGAGAFTPGATPGRPNVNVLSRRQRWLVLASPFVAVIVAWALLPLHIYSNVARHRPTAAPIAAVMDEPDGPKLFSRHCAVCHGGQGNGVGIALLNPPARNFGEGKFRLGTTKNAFPSDDDLYRIVREGIPGSAMTGFPDLSVEECQAIISYVRRLTRSGVYQQLLAKAEQMGDVDTEQLRSVADARTRPADPLSVPADFPPPTTDSIGRGRQVYVTACASCHGPEGRGDGPQVKDLKNDDGTPTRPRDLTLGRFKCGGTPQQLFARIVLGMPGTPMPASNTLKPNEAIDVVNYVRSLVAHEPKTAAATSTGAQSQPTNR